jgi:HAD superfamily hydrolase (TIGR01450 family)
MAWILDLDGVVWRGDQPISGSIAAIRKLRSNGERVLFLTNNSSMTVGAYLDKMNRLGLDCERQDLCTAAQSSARLISASDKVLVCGGPGIVEAVEERGAVAVREVEPGITAVMVGWHRDFDFGRLTAAYRAVFNGARLIGTNEDPTYPSADGDLPGGGSIVAAVAYASGQQPVFGGKPNQSAADLVFERLGLGANPSVEDRRQLLMVGDRPSTDGGMARQLGGRFGLVLSGVTSESDFPVYPSPDLVAPDLAELVNSTLRIVE